MSSSSKSVPSLRKAGSLPSDIEAPRTVLQEPDPLSEEERRSFPPPPSLKPPSPPTVVSPAQEVGEESFEASGSQQELSDSQYSRTKQASEETLPSFLEKKEDGRSKSVSPTPAVRGRPRSHGMSMPSDDPAIRRLSAESVNPEAPTTVRFDEAAFKALKRMVMSPDLFIVQQAFAAVPFSRETELVNLVVSVFESEPALTGVLKHFIRLHIESTEEPNTLFRSNTAATKLMHSFCNMFGQQYLVSTLKPLVAEVIKKKLIFELNPEMLPPHANLEDNIVKAREVCQKFIDAIVASLPHCPPSFLDLCYFMYHHIQIQFPEIGDFQLYRGAASFFFLRFFCPGIFLPNMHGITQSKPSKEISRTLVLISKILQALANGTYGKDAYMAPMTDFIKANTPVISSFYSKVSSGKPITRASTPEHLDSYSDSSQSSSRDLSPLPGVAVEAKKSSKITRSISKPESILHECSLSDLKRRSTSKPESKLLDRRAFVQPSPKPIEASISDSSITKRRSHESMLSVTVGEDEVALQKKSTSFEDPASVHKACSSTLHLSFETDYSNNPGLNIHEPEAMPETQQSRRSSDAVKLHALEEEAVYHSTRSADDSDIVTSKVVPGKLFRNTSEEFPITRQGSRDALREALYESGAALTPRSKNASQTAQVLEFDLPDSSASRYHLRGHGVCLLYSLWI